MNDDASLLRAYADQGSEAAFTELVRRHLDLVYGAALRRTGGDTHNAADVAQQVFTNLARHARKLSGHAVLSAWLHTATRNAALNLMISDQRRQAREAEALALGPSDESGPDWERLRPLLDDAIDKLPEADRAAVVLRYLEKREFADIGERLGLSADAARMRADRALEKLRAVLARRGVSSTSAALATVFANQVAASAPVGLATSITATALANSGSSAAVAAGFFMSTKTTAMVVAIVAIGSTAYEWNHAFRAESERAALTVDRDNLRAKLSTEQQNAARASQDLAALRSELDALKTKQAVVEAPQLTTSSPDSPQPLDPPLRTIEQLTNAGHATPNAAFETFYWAMASGDMKALASSVAYDPLGTEIIQKTFSSLSPDAQAFYGSPEVMIAAVALSAPAITVTRLEIVGVQPNGPDEAMISFRRNDDPKIRTTPMRNSPNGWMFVMQGSEKLSSNPEFISKAENIAASGKK